MFLPKTTTILALVVATTTAAAMTANGNAVNSEPTVDPSSITPEQMEKDAAEIYNRIADVINAAAIGSGILAAIVGYRYKKVTFFLIGFAVAGGIAFVAMDTLTTGSTYRAWAPATAMVLAGLVVGLLTSCLVKVGIFGAGASLGVVLAMLLQSAVLFRVTTLPSNVLMYICMGVFGLILGLVALKLERLIVILATSFGGSFLTVYGIGHFVGNLPSPFDLSQTIERMAAEGTDSVPVMWWVYIGIIFGLGSLTSLLQHYVTAKKSKGVVVLGQGPDREYLVLESGLSTPKDVSLIKGDSESKYSVQASTLVY